MTWAPGEPMLIPDRLIADGGWIERPGCTVLNLYRPPMIVPGDAGDADAVARPHAPGLSRTMPSTSSRWLAHRVQRPQDEDQPRAGARRRAGHRQGHDAGAGQAGGRAWNFTEVSPQADARPLQRLPQVGDPARQRGARPRRRRPLRLLRPHEDAIRRRRPTCCASTRSICANTTCPNCLRRHHHHQPQGRRHLPAGRRPPALRRAGPT